MAPSSGRTHRLVNKCCASMQNSLPPSEFLRRYWMRVSCSRRHSVKIKQASCSRLWRRALPRVAAMFPSSPRAGRRVTLSWSLL